MRNVFSTIFRALLIATTILTGQSTLQDVLGKCFGSAGR
jgi:hypothetical protein